MKSKLVVVVTFSLLLVTMSILTSKIEPVETSSEETVVPYVWSQIVDSTSSYNDSDPSSRSDLISGKFNMTFSLPDENGVINITIPKESNNIEPSYDPISNTTIHNVPIADAYGKIYTVNGTGDVDIISMSNDTGMFFWKDGVWHPPGEEWIGNGESDPAGSAWLKPTSNISIYHGNGTNGLLLGSYLTQSWLTTGFCENTVNETASRLNGSYVNATGFPFSSPFVGGIVTWVWATAYLNIPFWQGEHLDLQSKTDQFLTKQPAVMATLFSPANLYVTDPENRHIGADPTTGEYVNEIPGAFYSGPGSHPQRVVIPDPVDGAYAIKIVGTSTGEYTLVVELATVEKTTTNTYTGNISIGQILESQVNISEGEMASTEPALTSPVGGIYIPVNKLELLAPYIGLTILLAAAVTTVVYVKKRKRNTEIIS